MAVSIAGENEEDVLAHEMQLARGAGVVLLALRQRDDVLSNQARTHKGHARDVIRKEACEAAGRLVRAAILDSRRLQQGVQGFA